MDIRPIHVSNVMLMDQKVKKPTRVGYKTITKKVKKQDENVKVRYAKNLAKSWIKEDRDESTSRKIQQRNHARP